MQSNKIQKDYAYLFWEALTSNHISNSFFLNQLTRGDNLYCFKSEEIDYQLEDLLRKRGLNDKEVYDFISYWIDELKQKKYVIFYFLDKEVYQSLPDLQVEPKAFQMIRVLCFLSVQISKLRLLK